jgi:hypothetical protein
MNGSSSNSQDPASSYWKDDFLPLQAAGKSILRELRGDEAAPDADLYRRITNSMGTGTADTKSHNYFAQESCSLSNLSHQRSVPLPPFLAQQLEQAKVSTYMGLFPQAELSWLTVDDKLYLWSYNTSQNSMDPQDFSWFTVPSHRPIVSVGLVPPKQGKLV